MTLLRGVTIFPPRGITVYKLPQSLSYHHHPFLFFLDESGENIRCMPLSFNSLSLAGREEDATHRQIRENKKSRDFKVHWSFILEHKLKQDSILKEGRKNMKTEVHLCFSQMHMGSGSASPAWLTLLYGPCYPLWYFRIHIHTDHAEEVISFTMSPLTTLSKPKYWRNSFDRVY